MLGGFWVGADPGGKGNFGLAFLDISGCLICASVSSVDEAVEQIVGRGKPLGMGIDAPMWWSSCKAGAREADTRIRKKYGIPSGTVQSPNSLRGAALVGGMMLVYRVRQKFARAMVTETHPKALLHALRVDGPGFAEWYEIPATWNNEHERDAAVSAVCAREGFMGRWSTDLALQRHASEQDPRSYWLTPMCYFWPEPL